MTLLQDTVLALFNLPESKNIPLLNVASAFRMKPSEAKRVLNKLVNRGFIVENQTQIYSITEAGKEYVEKEIEATFSGKYTVDLTPEQEEEILNRISKLV